LLPFSSFIVHKTILLCHLYGYKTWSFTLREENRLRVPENSVLRRIFGSKREEVEGARTKLHNEDLHNLYDSPNIIRVITSRG